jgi:hypothetical protein
MTTRYRNQGRKGNRFAECIEECILLCQMSFQLVVRIRGFRPILVERSDRQISDINTHSRRANFERRNALSRQTEIASVETSEIRLRKLGKQKTWDAKDSERKSPESTIVLQNRLDTSRQVRCLIEGNRIQEQLHFSNNVFDRKIPHSQNHSN